jgi:hypothetical protein
MVQTPYMKIWIEEGILYCIFTEGLVMDLSIATHCVEKRIGLSNGISYPCVIDMCGVRSVNKEARDFLATKGSELITAGALIVGSALTRTLGNIFLHINKPEVPLKLFSDKTTALEWLKSLS